MTTQLVFVYGTLKKGKSNHDLLKNSKFLNKAILNCATMHSLGHYPAIKNGLGHVHGEVYEVDAVTMDRLDRLEGHPVFYKREIVDLSGGQKAWTYFLVGDVSRYPIIPHGNWE